MSTDQLYRYRHASTSDEDGLRLATSGGPADHPHFFDGFVERPAIVAAALLTVAKVGRTRFYTPPGMVAAILRTADPLVTSDGARLRFESLSADCGVYTRLDLLPEGLDRPPHARGTTNVDFNAPMRDALSGLAGADPMHLAVGDDEMRVRTLDGQSVERRVPLPERWVRSLAELTVIARAMTPGAEYTGAQVRRLLQTQPRGVQRGTLYAVPSPTGPRLATRTAPGGVGVADLQRLRVIEPLLLHTRTVRTYGLDTGSAWVLDLTTARLTVLLSPAVNRGFSGEGGLLDSGPEIGGRAGFDLTDGEPFERQLPLDAVLVQPRLREAQALVAAGAVTVTEDRAVVLSGSTGYVVRHAADGSPRCTCAWFATHALNRGPCKHILAARLAAGQ
jgi:SWIM zinc finger